MMTTNAVDVVLLVLVLLDVERVYVCGKLEQQVTAAVGDSVTLPCTTTFNTSVDWRYHDSPFSEPRFVYSNYKFYEHVSARFAISDHRTSTAAALYDFSLVINNVQLNDTGLYTCSEDGGVATKHTVALLVLPSLPQRTSPLTQTTQPGAQPPSTTETSSSATVGLIVVVVLLLVLTVAEAIVITLLLIQRRKCQQVKGTLRAASVHLLEDADPNSENNAHSYVALQPIQHKSAGSPVVGHESVAIQVPDGHSGYSDQETAVPLYHLVGCVQPNNDQFPKSATATSAATDDIVAAAAPVCGVGVLGDCLYVIRRCRQQSEVEIYDRHSLTRRSVELAQRLRVHPQPVCMAVCPSHRCLYIAYSDPVSMVERQAVAGTAGNAWEIKSGKPVGISVTTMAIVIVTLQDSNKLVEFNPDGSWKRDIVLQAPAASPCHAIQLQAGKYLVCFDAADDCGVRLVDVQGRVLKAVDTRTKRPWHLAADDRGFVFVCDSVGNRVTLIDASSLDYILDVLPTSTGQQKPTAVCFDETCTRMFVGENCDDGRVLAFSSLDVMMHYRC